MLQQGAKSTGDNWRDNYKTPRNILDLVDRLFGERGWFDPCPPSPTFNGLLRHWGPQPIYANPPFSEFSKWVEHGIKQPGEQIWICHSNTETQWYQTLIKHSDLMVLTKYRVKFIDPRTDKPGESPPTGADNLLSWPPDKCLPGDF